MPSYPRLPPITSHPAGPLPELSNPAFYIEEDQTSTDRPAESPKLSLHPAVNVEDVDSDKVQGGVVRHGNNIKIYTPEKSQLKTLTVPVVPKGGRQR